MKRWASCWLAIAISAAAFSSATAAAASTKAFDAFRDGLRELGYIEGANIMIEYRLAAWDYGRLPAMAPDLVRLRGRYHRHRHPESRTNCAGRHSDDPNRRGYRRDRSGGTRAHHEPWASGRQPHRLYRTRHRA
jgi:hypothetical protein